MTYISAFRHESRHPVTPATPPGSGSSAQGPVTGLLSRVRAGDQSAESELYGLVYDDLERAARSLLRRERQAHTLQPGDLVNEAYLRLAGSGVSDATNRPHLLAIAARAMRFVLVDHARRRGAAKRKSVGPPVRITNAEVAVELDFAELIALDDALERLGQRNPRLPRVVELRFFAGLGEEEIAAILGVTSRTVQRDWAAARAWLYKEMYPTE